MSAIAIEGAPPSNARERPREKKPYVAPVLRPLGRIADVHLASAPPGMPPRP